MHALIDTVYSSRSTFFVYPNIPCIKFFRNLMSYEFQGTCIEVLQLCWCDFCQENVI